MIAEAVDEDQASFGSGFRLPCGSASAPSMGMATPTFQVFVYSFLPSSTVCQPSSTDMTDYFRMYKYSRPDL